MSLQIFVADGGNRDRRSWCMDHGVGLLMSPEYATLPPHQSIFMIDNGAFRAWKQNEDWDEPLFYHVLSRFHSAGVRPYGVVVPDIVKGGKASLKRSEEHLHLIPKEFPRYLAVQEGMSLNDVVPLMPLIDGIFVGSPGCWKWRTAKSWVDLAHAWGKRCHLGQVGTIKGYMAASALGVDSVDGSTLMRHRKLDRILTYRQMEVEQMRLV